MTRRALAALMFAALCAFADSSADVFRVVADMASGLSEDHLPAFSNALSASMPERQKLIDDVRATLDQADVKTSIERISDEGDDQKRTLVLDWQTSFHRKGPDLRIMERHEAVTLIFAREGKRWKVISVSPLSFFTPPNFQ